MTAADNVDYSLVLAQLDKERQMASRPVALQSGDGGGTFNSMSERLGKLEGEIGGLKQSQTILMSAIAFVSAVLLAASLYLVARVDTLGSQVSDLPGKISAELRDVNKTLAEAITASKQTPPQVILMPAPTAATMGYQPPAPTPPAKN